MAERPLEIGFRLGKYEVLAHVASGGMGVVYKAKDLKLNRIVALKVLSGSPDLGDRILRRFRREAHHAARLSHPNIVTLFDSDHDTEHNLHYLAMEFIDGIDLAQFIERRGKLPPQEARRILMQIVKALDHAYTHGVVHRDIKPSNILLARVDEKTIVKLTDLGLARGEGDDDFKVTREGNTVGTIDYMAPEQARDSASADTRSDLYSLGCTTYHMLAGKAPFAEGGLGERLYKHLSVPAPDVRQFNPAVSGGFWAILLKMLAKAPEDRYATPAELLRELKKTSAETTNDDAKQASPNAAEQPSSKRRRKTVPETVVESATAPLLLVSLEQARMAAAFHERAVQVLAEGGGNDYARELVAKCLKLDPFNIKYIKTLRTMNGKASSSTFGRWFGSLNTLAIKSKLRLAHSSGDWRKVLEQGEEVLAHQPADVDAHLGLAGAAEKLKLPELALWYLEQGRQLLPQNLDLMRAQAKFHESRQEWKPALALWEKVREIDPNDYEAGRKINDISAQDLMKSGHYQR